MTTRRDFVKWVLYLGTTAALPAISAAPDFPKDILEGMSHTNKKIADSSGNAAAYRAAEDDAFEDLMQQMWRDANGDAHYIRVFQDLAVVPEHTEWADEFRTSRVTVPAAYVSFFQYRRA